MTTKRILLVDDVAELFGVSASAIRHAAQDGTLPAAKMFSKWVFDLDEIHEHVRIEVTRQRQTRAGREQAIRNFRGTGQRAKRGASR